MREKMRGKKRKEKKRLEYLTLLVFVKVHPLNSDYALLFCLCALSTSVEV